TYQLLNSDEHSNFLKKNGRNPSDYRPDIAHQQEVESNFCQFFVEMAGQTFGNINHGMTPVCQLQVFLHKHSITLHEKMQIWIAGCFSHSSEKLVDIQDYVNGINNDMNLVFVVGAMAHGKIDKDYVEDYLSISDYPLSAAYCISMITNAVERKWKIL
ncbi:hypothetical protein HAX54_048279, partial [Datura stramonium]|nr:hypothetical protein [Datura stramonium]